MKKPWKTFTFWAVVVSAVIIALHQTGLDSNSILLIGFNPLFTLLSRYPKFISFMNSGLQIPCRGLMWQDSISIYWYLGSLITFAFYGFLLDLLRINIKKLRRDEA